jgi:hypothetical protein|tara:strand:+ start:11025 stop:11324 length:300 start_codon:yes stop_codon:yes gene_type:complete
MQAPSRILIKELLAEENPDAYIYDGADDAILGLVYLEAGPVLAYSYTAFINIFMERDGMTIEEAIEFFDFNVEGLRLGEYQPLIVDDTSLVVEELNVLT